MSRALGRLMRRHAGLPGPPRNVNGSGGFTPASASGLFLWHEPGLTFDFTDAARTTPVTVDGDLIGGETDRSSAANHLSQSFSSKRPMFKQYTNGGKTFYSAFFDGVDDYLEHPTPASGPDTTNRFWFCAAIRTTDISSSWFLFHIGVETTKQSLQLVLRSGALSLDYWGGSNVCTFGATTVNTMFVVSGGFDGSNFISRVNGAQVTSTSVTGVTIGSNKCQFGNCVAAALPWHGDCPIFTAYNAIPSAANQLTLERYVGGKVGVTF